MRLVLFIFLALLFLFTVILYKTAQALPLKELKRRTRGHDKNASSVYKVAAYGRSANLLLVIIGFASAAAVLAMAGFYSGWLAIALLAIFAYLAIGWRASANSRGWNWDLSRFYAPVIAWLLNYLQPILDKFIHDRPEPRPANHVYEKEDLLEFIKAQNAQADNRIPETELKMAYNSLTFGDKNVDNVMTPLRKVKLISGNEVAGPMLTDELYKTGFSRFPVVTEGSLRAANPKIAGILYLRDLIGYQGASKVKDLMDKKVFYINETQSLRDALAAFLKNHRHLFIVVNNFEEVVGTLSIEDVVEQILGENIVDEFDQYDDLRAVAGIEVKKQHAAHQDVKSSEQTDDSVVE